MDYHTEYNNLIYKRATQIYPPAGYTEKHHIIPRALGGSNDPDNLVVLTAAEHFIAHYYLWKIHGGKMAYPFFLMYKQNRAKLDEKTLLTFSEEYQKCREETSKLTSERCKGKPGKPVTEEQRKQRSERAKGRTFWIDKKTGRKYYKDKHIIDLSCLTKWKKPPSGLLSKILNLFSLE